MKVGMRVVEVEALTYLGRLEGAQGWWRAAQPHLEAAIARARTVRDTGKVGLALGVLGRCLAEQGDAAMGREHAEEGERLIRERGQPEAIVMLLCQRVHIEVADGAIEAAQRVLDEALHIGAGLESGEGTELRISLQRAQQRLPR